MVIVMAVIPVSAIAAQLPEDGLYTVDVTLSGGSGRAEVESPAQVTILDGKMTAVITWSSPYYDYMLVDGDYYYPLNNDGNSTFEIPVSVLDEDIPVSAETVAMSVPYVIDYTLHFDGESLSVFDDNQVPTMAKLLIAAAIITGLALAVFLVTKTRRKGKNESR